MYSRFTKLVLKYKLTIILLLVFWFILSCHCMKPLNVLNFMKKKEEKKSVKEGFPADRFMFFSTGNIMYPAEEKKRSKKMCGYSGKIEDSNNYEFIEPDNYSRSYRNNDAKELQDGGYFATGDGYGAGKGIEYGIPGWEGTIKGEWHMDCRRRAKKLLKGNSPEHILVLVEWIVNQGGGLVGFLMFSAIVGTIIALKNTRKGISLFDDLIKKKKEEKEKCDARSKEGKCVDEIVGTTPSRTQLRMRLETQEKEDYEIRKSEADQKGLQDAVTMMSGANRRAGGGKAYRNKRSKKKGGSKKRK